MNLLLDEGVPLRLAEHLRRFGHAVDHVLELGIGGATDDSLMVRAAENRQSIVTLDSDFHSLLARSGAMRPTVVRLRIEGMHEAQLAVLVNHAIEAHRDELEAGAAMSILPGRVRLRPLPIGQPDNG